MVSVHAYLANQKNVEKQPERLGDGGTVRARRASVPACPDFKFRDLAAGPSPSRRRAFEDAAEPAPDARRLQHRRPVPVPMREGRPPAPASTLRHAEPRIRAATKKAIEEGQLLRHRLRRLQEQNISTRRKRSCSYAMCARKAITRHALDKLGSHLRCEGDTQEQLKLSIMALELLICFPPLAATARVAQPLDIMRSCGRRDAPRSMVRMGRGLCMPLSTGFAALDNGAVRRHAIVAC
jgi:hypothetical protein